MTLFLSTYSNKVDRKGRVSVPASFRSALSSEPFQGVVLFRSNNHECLEGFAYSAMEELCGRLDHYDIFSSEQDDMATAIFGEAVQLPLDGDGRVVLPASLLEFAGLDEIASFVGLGKKFQIWSPERLDQRREIARKAVQDKGLTLPKERAHDE